MEYCVQFCVSDEPVELSVSGSETLLHVLREKLGFNQIYDSVAAAVSALAEDGAVTLEGLRAADAAARAHVKEHIS